MDDQCGDFAINMFPLREGVSLRDFARFSSEIDQPICLQQEVFRGFDVFAANRRDQGAPSVDIVEVMHVRDWGEWESVRDNLESLKPVTERFAQLVDSHAIRSVYGTRVAPRGLSGAPRRP